MKVSAIAQQPEPVQHAAASPVANICVADRGNRRVQVYDPVEPVRIIEGMGAPWTVHERFDAYCSAGTNRKIYKFSLDGKLIGWANIAESWPSGPDPDCTASRRQSSG